MTDKHAHWREATGASGEWAELGLSTPDLDTVFDLLADRRRRLALYYLIRSDDAVASLDELADWVTRLETADTGEPPTEDYRRRVVTSLHHAHLPTFAEASVVEYDARSETVRYLGQPTLEELAEHTAATELHEG
ncbi:hypothetical protein ACFQH6_18370 [Halobacteriaceae archaeon GCM10025711]